MTASAVVFAYHDVGCRCLSALLEAGVRVPLVVTHRDNPAETIWFGSVERLAREAGLEVATPADPNDPAFVASAINVTSECHSPISKLRLPESITLAAASNRVSA